MLKHGPDISNPPHRVVIRGKVFLEEFIDCLDGHFCHLGNPQIIWLRVRRFADVRMSVEGQQEEDDGKGWKADHHSIWTLAAVVQVSSAFAPDSFLGRGTRR